MLTSSLSAWSLGFYGDAGLRRDALRWEIANQRVAIKMNCDHLDSLYGRAGCLIETGCPLVLGGEVGAGWGVEGRVGRSDSLGSAWRSERVVGRVGDLSLSLGWNVGRSFRPEVGASLHVVHHEFKNARFEEFYSGEFTSLWWMGWTGLRWQIAESNRWDWSGFVRFECGEFDGRSCWVLSLDSVSAMAWDGRAGIHANWHPARWLSYNFNLEGRYGGTSGGSAHSSILFFGVRERYRFQNCRYWSAQMTLGIALEF